MEAISVVTPTRELPPQVLPTLPDSGQVLLSSKLLSDQMTHQTNIHYFSFHTNQGSRGLASWRKVFSVISIVYVFTVHDLQPPGESRSGEIGTVLNEDTHSCLLFSESWIADPGMKPINCCRLLSPDLDLIDCKLRRTTDSTWS